MSKFRFRPADDCLLPLHPQIQPAILRPSESLIGVLLCKKNLMLCYATTHGLLFLHDLASISLAANGSIRPNARQMAPLSAIRLVLLPRGSINSKALTLMRPLVRLLKTDFPPSGVNLSSSIWTNKNLCTDSSQSGISRAILGRGKPHDRPRLG